jgi:hypothetical protein
MRLIYRVVEARRADRPDISPGRQAWDMDREGRERRRCATLCHANGLQPPRPAVGAGGTVESA